MAEAITSYIHLSISVAARGIKVQTVDTPLLLAYHTKWGDYVREYTSLAGMVADGFAVTDPVYYMAKALLSQDRKVSSFKVGRRATAFTAAYVLTITADSGTITCSITKDGTTRTYTQTGGGGGIPAEATAMALQMNNDASGWGSGGSGELTIAANANDVELDAVSPANDGEIWYFDDLAQMTFDDATADPGLAADLTALRAEDDDWYAVSLDSCSDAEGAGLAAALSSEEKIVLVGCQNFDCESGSGLASTMSTAAYTNAAMVYSKHSMAEYPACAALGYSLPWPPGAIDWMFKSYVGVTASDLSASAISALKGEYANMYVQVVRDAGIFQEAVFADGSYIDIKHLKDYLTFRIREAIWNLLRQSPKVPYTDKGAEAAGAEILKVLKSTANNAAAAGGDALVLTDSEGRSTFDFDYTPADSQLAADKANRIFRGLTWRAQLSQGIRQFYITGELV